ncbi:MAG: hypothetical protein V1735_02455 [Nanoarchaeota archaeon]
MDILLDTNVLLMPGSVGVDIVTQLQAAAPGRLCCLDRTIDELQNIVATQCGKHRQAAKLGLLLIEKGMVSPLKTEKVKKGAKSPSVDALLEEYAKKGYLVATQDRALQRRLSRYLVLRQKKYFKLMGE